MISQLLNGLPLKPGKHEQIGRWLLTLHCALLPQAPGHGSLHRLLMHAMTALHSELIVHSGLHLGGELM